MLWRAFKSVKWNCRSNRQMNKHIHFEIRARKTAHADFKLSTQPSNLALSAEGQLESKLRSKRDKQEVMTAITLQPMWQVSLCYNYVLLFFLKPKIHDFVFGVANCDYAMSLHECHVLDTRQINQKSKPDVLPSKSCNKLWTLRLPLAAWVQGQTAEVPPGLLQKLFSNDSTGVGINISTQVAHVIKCPYSLKARQELMLDHDIKPLLSGDIFVYAKWHMTHKSVGATANRQKESERDGACQQCISVVKRLSSKTRTKPVSANTALWGHHQPKAEKYWDKATPILYPSLCLFARWKWEKGPHLLPFSVSALSNLSMI